jgi:FkbM family methyltransferase
MAVRGSRRQFDWVEVGMAVVVAGTIMAVGGFFVVEDLLSRWDGTPDAEAAPLAETYGPTRFSRHAEEWIIRDFFQDERDGFFVDVGANHYRDESNTYYLETSLGWQGIAVEPLQQFEEDYRVFRSGTRFRPFFVSDASDEQAKLFLLAGDTLMASGVREFTERHGPAATEVAAMTITLTDLLDKEGVATFDFLSMDIELWEPRALAGFDIERFRPRLVCIESHIEVRQAILEYFARHRYVLVGKYLRADVWNLYFAPAPSA